MNVALLNGLSADSPAADARTAPDTAALRHHTWQSAMEHAQLAGWFKPGGDQAGAQEEDRPAPYQTPAPHAGRGDVLLPMAGTSPQPTGRRSARAIALAQALQQVDGAARPAAADVRETQSPPHALPTEAAQGAAAGATAATASLARGLALEVQRYIVSAVPQQTGVGAGRTTAADMNSTLLAQSRPMTPAVSQRSLPVAVPVLAGFRSPLPVLAATVAGGDPLPVVADAASDSEEGHEAAPAGISPAIPRLGAGAEAPEVRVHIDWSHEGARVWLGVDEQRLPVVTGLARHLERWLEAGGVKLATLVCNGRTIYTRYSQRRPE